MSEVSERLELLRAEMKREGADWFFATSDDYHGSEYVADFFKVREHYTGFTGENAFLIVNKSQAFMWTDGRFFIQAETELKGSGVTLMKMGEPGVPSINEFVKENVKSNDKFFFDGRMVTTGLGKRLEGIVASNGGACVTDNDIAGRLWKNRPFMPSNRVSVYDVSITGESVVSKIKRIREALSSKNIPYHFIGSIDDIAWITNMRGADIECNPVFLSYMFFSPSETILFIQESELTNDVREYLSENDIKTLSYDTVLRFLNTYEFYGSVLLDESSVNYSCFKAISSKTDTVNEMNPSKKMKAVKNEVEIARLKKAYTADSVCVTKFIYWLKKTVKNQSLTEMDASDYLDSLRKKVPGFLDLSFPTISGYAKNGAIVHYTATRESNALLKPEGMLLVDSGGQYTDGTTDVTRTISLGSVTPAEKLHYTKVLCGMLSLSDAKFIYGCTGRNLDILARKPLWDLGLDFKHGTGHGVGYILNVHEGPQNIRWKYSDTQNEYPLEPGMITSDEPGIYIEGKYGIRIENVILCANDFENEFGRFLKFEHLTYVPFDRELIDISVMSAYEINLLNAYQKEVYEKTASFLSKEEAEWLYDVTLPFDAE